MNAETSPTQMTQQQPKSNIVEDGHTNGFKRARDSIANVSPPTKQAKHDLPSSPALSPIAASPITPTIQRSEIEIAKPPVTTPTFVLILDVLIISAAPPSPVITPQMSRAQTIASLPTRDVTYISLSSPATAVRFHPVQGTVLYGKTNKSTALTPLVATLDSQLQVWGVSQSNLLQSVSVPSPIKRIAISADGTYLSMQT